MCSSEHDLDRPIGNSIETDAELLSFDAADTETANRRYYGSFRKAKLNITARADHRLSANPENISIGTLGVMVPTQLCDLRLEGRYMNDWPGTQGRSPNAIDFEARWRTQIGSASRRESARQYVQIEWSAVSYKKQPTEITTDYQ